MTINELVEKLNDEIAKGNGDKKIFISDSNEVNGWHELIFPITCNMDDLEQARIHDESLEKEHLEDIVLLG